MVVELFGTRRAGTAMLLMGALAGRGTRRPVVLCIGDTVAVGAGLLTRVPVAMQRLGIEWLWRFGLSPRSLFMRYFIRS